jgi:hypothetical protein
LKPGDFDFDFDVEFIDLDFFFPFVDAAIVVLVDLDFFAEFLLAKEFFFFNLNMQYILLTI